MGTWGGGGGAAAAEKTDGRKQLPTFDNDSSHRRNFPFDVEGGGVVLSGVDEITAEGKNVEDELNVSLVRSFTT